jgi:hypothetical protein
MLLCKGVTTNLESHLAHHLTQLALFAVPHGDYVDEGSDVDSTASGRAQIHSTDSEQSSLPFGGAGETKVPEERTIAEALADLKLEVLRSLAFPFRDSLVRPLKYGKVSKERLRSYFSDQTEVTYIKESVSKRCQLIEHKDGKVAIAWMSSEKVWKILSTSCVVRPDHELQGDVVFATGVIDEVASSATDRARVMTTISGNPYDITVIGIDSEFLETLPEESQEEFVMQAVVELSQTVATADSQQDELGSANYRKYTVWRKQLIRFVGINERVLAIDGEYLHIMPASTGKTIFKGQGKTTTVHFSNIVGCKVTQGHPTNFKVRLIYGYILQCLLSVNRFLSIKPPKPNDTISKQRVLTRLQRLY